MAYINIKCMSIQTPLLQKFTKRKTDIFGDFHLDNEINFSDIIRYPLNGLGETSSYFFFFEL